MSEAEGWKEMCRVLADANNMLDQRDALIRELVAVLDEIEQGRCARINRHGYGDCGAEGIVARVLTKAKAAGYDHD